MFDALSDLKLAWDMVTSSTIKNCFRTACFAVDEETSRKTPSGQGEEQPSTSSSAPGTAGYPSPGGNTEPLLSRLLKEWNISLSEYFSVDEDIVRSGPEKTATCTGPSPSATVTSQDSDSDHDDCGEVEETVTRKKVLEHVHRTNINLMQTEGQNAVMKAFFHFKEALDRHTARLSTQTKITQFFSKPGAERKSESQVKSEQDQGEKFYKKQDQPSAEQTQPEGERERDNCQAEVTLEESSKKENGEQKETEPTGDYEENEATDERQTQGQHGGKEWEAGVEMEEERATGDDESRGGRKTVEERQHEDTEHLQDTGKSHAERKWICRDDRRGKRGNQSQ